MIDREALDARLEKLEEYVGYLKEFQERSFGDVKSDPTLRGAIERYLQLSIECAVDTGGILISSLGLRKPENSYGVIMALGEAGIIPEDFANRFAPVTGFRNILVHEYAAIDLRQVYRHLQEDLVDFDRFARHIAQWLQEPGRK